MSVSLRIATGDDHARALPLIAACHGEQGLPSDQLELSLTALLAGVPNAVLYLIGPPKSPVGYALVSFGFAFALGGATATIAELYIRPPVRGRGMGGEAVRTLANALSSHGIRALHIDTPLANPRATVFCRRHGFGPRDRHSIMTRTL